MTFHINILETGSSGNSVIIDGVIMLDAGVPETRVRDTYHVNLKELCLLFVSHKHSDHKSLPLIRTCIKNGTDIRIPQAVYDEIQEEGRLDISKYDNITCHDKELSFSKIIKGITYHFILLPQKHHDIINYGIVIEKENERLLYVTDLDTVQPTEIGPGLMEAGSFDVIIMEGNYDEIWLREYIQTSIEAFTGETYDVSNLTDTELSKFVKTNYQDLPKSLRQDLFRAVQNMRHLSKQQARAYVSTHLNPKGIYYEVHRSSKYYERPTDWDRHL